MAYNASNEERTELANIQKNNRGDHIVVTQIRNKNTGNESVDIRNYYTDDEGELKPTSKGIRFSAELTSDIVRAIFKSMHPIEVADVFSDFKEVLESEEWDDNDEEGDEEEYEEGDEEE